MAFLTVNEYKALVGVDLTDTRNDVQITALLDSVERAISKFTDRRFVEAAGAVTPRDFEYDGSGFLDIDDCTNITSVSTDSGYVGQSYSLDQSEWTAQPGRETSDDDPHYYLILHARRLFGPSPEMGFERNLDKIGVSTKPVIVTVTAQWGWAEIPADVKLAAAWTIQDALTAPASSPTSEAIEGFSRSWSAGTRALGLPNRARDLLANYVRVYG